ncbi:MAG: hypothetical protein HYV28_00785 [Ignavibacteriales bacterium]|nr:hypothetical protein [Ignavibacteriales bacterium]
MNKIILLLFAFGIYFTELSGQITTQNNTMPQSNQNMLSTADIFYFTETMTFLTLPVSAESYMLGNTGAARITDDPMAVAINPAQLGMQSFRTNYTVGYNFINSNHYISTWHKSMNINAGFKLGDFVKSSIPLSFGIGYSNLYNQYKRITMIHFEDPFWYKEISANEKVDMYSFGIGLDYAIKVSAGATYKHCLPEYEDTETKNLYDFGLLANFPIHELLGYGNQNASSSEAGFSYTADISLGYSRNNFGSEAIGDRYIATFPGETRKIKTSVPSFIQTGLSTVIGLKYNKNNGTWQPLCITFSVEERDGLTYVSGETLKHQGIMGDINFYQDILMGKTNPSTTKHKGFRIDIGEMCSLLSGSSEGKLYFPSLCEEISGWAINSKGFFKVLAMFSPDILNTKAGYVLQHLNVQCTFGKAVSSEKFVSGYEYISPRVRKFYSINISWSNW